MRGPKNPSKNFAIFWNWVPEGSHSRPPGRSKSMLFQEKSGRASPSDVWPGPPRCLGAAPCSGPAAVAMVMVMMMMMMKVMMGKEKQKDKKKERRSLYTLTADHPPLRPEYYPSSASHPTLSR